jgi:hypothetical protein
MKNKEDELLKALIATEIKKLPNKDFTVETIRKMSFLEPEKKMDLPPSFGLIFFTPLYIYFLFFVLCFILKLLSVTGIRLEFLVQFLETIILSHVSLSIILAFSILGLFDNYLKKEGKMKRTKSNKRYSTSL